MNTALWIMASFLALAFTVGGAAQVVLPKERYRRLAASQHWVDDFSSGHLTAIGSIKIVGAIGLLLPAAFVPELVPLAACGLMLVMAGAATTRFRRSEWRFFVGDVVFIAAFAFLAWGRFSLEPLA